MCIVFIVEDEKPVVMRKIVQRDSQGEIKEIRSSGIKRSTCQFWFFYLSILSFIYFIHSKPNETLSKYFYILNFYFKF